MKPRFALGVIAAAVAAVGLAACTTTETVTNPDGTQTITSQSTVIDTASLTTLVELASLFKGEPNGARSPMPPRDDPTIAAAIEKARAAIKASQQKR